MFEPPWEMLWKALKSAYKYTKARAFGATITLIGPKMSGKTQVFNYMKTNKLRTESTHASTIRAETDSAVKYVGDEDNYLEVLNITDTTGQESTTAGADAIGISKPSVVILVLDGETNIKKNIRYTREILKRLASFDDRVLKGIRVVAVFLNKLDKATNRQLFRSQVQELLKVARTAGATLANRCIACETVFVKTQEFGESLAEQAFQDIKNVLKKS